MALTDNTARDEWRKRMRLEKRCLNCGKQDERTLSGMSRCQSCADKENRMQRERMDAAPQKRAAKNAAQREWRRMLRERCLCVDCKKQDAYTLNGHARCFECSQKNSIQACKVARATQEKRNINAKARRDQWREDGRCTRCGGVKLPYDLHMTCAICRAKSKAKREDKLAKQDSYYPRRTPGLCYFCLHPVMEGKKVCQRCYDVRMPGMKKARETAWKNNGKHVWRRLNDTMGGKATTQGGNA